MKTRTNLPRGSSVALAAVLLWSFTAPPSARAQVTGDLRIQKLDSEIFGNARKLRVWLPPGYSDAENRGRSYPVLYLNDGQNLFDAETSLFGPYEWKVDETAARLIEEERIPPIVVVGVDNAGRRGRAEEYLPYPDETLEPPVPHPRGDLYDDFLVTEVIPFVEARFRVTADPALRALGGSSYGALAALHAAMERPDLFSRLLLESPSFYVDDYRIFRDVDPARIELARVYLGVGTNELGLEGCPEDQETNAEAVDGVRRAADLFRGAGPGGSANLKVVVDPCARHDERAWAARLPAALEFLFAEGPSDSFRHSDTLLARRLDSIVPGLLRRHDVPGIAVGLMEDGRVAFTRGYGCADCAGGRSMTDSTLFNLASLSKSVTAWGVQRLSRTQGLELDAPVERWLEPWPFQTSRAAWDGVTPRRILSHTAGLSMPSVPWFPADSARPGLEAVLRGEVEGVDGLRLVHEPGDRWSYSGGGYALLQLGVEARSGQPFGRYMRTRLFEPLRMSETTFAVDTVDPARVALPHDDEGDPIELYRLVGVAAGGLYSTARDFTRFLTAYVDRPEAPAGRGVLEPGDIEEMLTPIAEVELPDVDTGGATYGLGHNLHRAAAGERIAYHSGANPGFLAYFVVAPDSGRGLVLMANGDGGVPVIAEILALWAGHHGMDLPPLY